MRLRSSNTGVPGALSMTWMDVRDEAEAEEVRQRARAIAAEMARGSGFIGWVGIGIAERLYTLTLWDDPEAIGNLAETPCTRPRSERCSSPTLVRRFTPVSGFLIISIRAGSGVPGAERSSTSIVPTHPARVVSRCRRDAAISKPELSESQWAIAL